MPVINALTFSKDYIIDKLVAHFNSQPENRRIVGHTDVPFFNVKVVTDANDNPTLVIGNSATGKPISQYAGEATFVWVGPRGVPVTAEPAHFFEVSKYISNKTTHVTGTLFGTYEYIPHTPITGGPNSSTLEFVPMPSAIQKQYTIRLALIDEFGDGWTGSTVTVYVNDVAYTGTLNDSGTEDIVQLAYIDFYVEPGDLVSVECDASGQYPEENRLVVSQFETSFGPDADPNFVVISQVNAGSFTTGELIGEFTVPFIPQP